MIEGNRILNEICPLAEVLPVEPVIRFCAVISAHEELRSLAIENLRDRWGETVETELGLPFEAGGYYSESMGVNLTKDLVAFRDPVDSAELADWKLWTNRLEDELVDKDRFDRSRPLNLDPGYITQAKLVLATTKDRDHRIYLREGIFGEITLTYTAKKWIYHRWTYPDYRTDSVARFAMRCRDHLRQCIQAGDGFRNRE